MAFVKIAERILHTLKRYVVHRHTFLVLFGKHRSFFSPEALNGPPPHLHQVPQLVLVRHEGERADEGEPVRPGPGDAQAVGATDVAVERAVAVWYEEEKIY